MPIAHAEGNYFADPETLDRLEGEGRVAFRYVGGAPNGAARDIAGISGGPRRQRRRAHAPPGARGRGDPRPRRRAAALRGAAHALSGARRRRPVNVDLAGPAGRLEALLEGPADADVRRGRLPPAPDARRHDAQPRHLPPREGGGRPRRRRAPLQHPRRGPIGGDVRRRARRGRRRARRARLARGRAPRAAAPRLRLLLRRVDGAARRRRRPARPRAPPRRGRAPRRGARGLPAHRAPPRRREAGRDRAGGAGRARPARARSRRRSPDRAGRAGFAVVPGATHLFIEDLPGLQREAEAALELAPGGARDPRRAPRGRRPRVLGARTSSASGARDARRRGPASSPGSSTASSSRSSRAPARRSPDGRDPALVWPSVDGVVRIDSRDPRADARRARGGVGPPRGGAPDRAADARRGGRGAGVDRPRGRVRARRALARSAPAARRAGVLVVRLHSDPAATRRGRAPGPR